MSYLEGQMMDAPLDLPLIWRHAERYHAASPITSVLPDRSMHRYTYGEMFARARRLGAALAALGVEPGDRVATVCWNSYHHLEMYFAVPSMGAVLHTVNPRLHAADLTYLLNHAEDRVILVDRTLLPLVMPLRERIPAQHIVVVDEGEDPPPGTLSYQALIQEADENAFHFQVADERQAAALCYTSGTTGRPKGVLYSHRSTVLHTMGAAALDGFRLTGRDVVSYMVPMFHVNAWGIPYLGAMKGAGQVLPGRYLDPVSVLSLLETERVTVTAGVPTIWLGVLALLEAEPGRYDLSQLRTMLVGGAAMPEAAIRRFDQHHIHVLHAWGMTETSPIGTVADWEASGVAGADSVVSDEAYRARAAQGRAVPLVEVDIINEDGEHLPWDGHSLGELVVRGPWVAGAYYRNTNETERFTGDGWFRTGDLVTIAPNGFVTLTDRSKDVIKSGGEWISSVALENALMAHPAVQEAAVVAVPDETWQERPLAVVVFKPEASATLAELRQFLAPHFLKWWLPDRLEVVDALPKSAAGKFLKTELRERFGGNPGRVEPAP